MNFVFGVVCKVPNSFAKSKNSLTPRNFAFRLGKPKVWTPPPNFFFTDAPVRFFSLRAILTYVVRASRRQLPPKPGLRASRRTAQAAFVVRRRRRSRRFGSVLLRGKVPAREGPPPFPRRGRVRRCSTWKTEIVDAKWWECLHICKASTFICKVNQIANLICKTIGGVFSTLFLQIGQCKVYLQSPWRCSKKRGWNLNYTRNFVERERGRKMG